MVGELLLLCLLLRQRRRRRERRRRFWFLLRMPSVRLAKAERAADLETATHVVIKWDEDERYRLVKRELQKLT
jgi:hypothetical protein